ncbi:MAG: hypothetical protein ACOYKA_00290 [Legionellaceae bacterium]
MKKLILMLLLSSMTAFAEVSSESCDIQTCDLLQNLGTYLGYDLSTAKKTEGSDTAVTPSDTLLDLSATVLVQQYAFVTLLGATPVNAFDDALRIFVPQDNPSYTAINSAANYTFQTQSGGGGAYNDPATGDQGKVSVSTLMDQETYQNDPVSQDILNTLGTPSYTQCMNNDMTAWIEDCTLLFDQKITANVVGSTLPSAKEYFTYDYNKDIIPQLNATTLTAPYLLTSNTSSTSGSSTSTSASTEEGLVASNQLQQATNYIRYVTSSVLPPTATTLKNYADLYDKAMNTDGSVSDVDKAKAHFAISTYIAKQRRHAAYRSAPTAILYKLLSDRMPQKSSDGKTQTSKALAEFTLGTYRILDPNKKTGEQWADKINTASSATVQKEIALVLADILYELHRMNEKTDQMMLLQSVQAIQSQSEGPILEPIETPESESTN